LRGLHYKSAALPRGIHVIYPNRRVRRNTATAYVLTDRIPQCSQDFDSQEIIQRGVSELLKITKYLLPQFWRKILVLKVNHYRVSLIDLNSAIIR